MSLKVHGDVYFKDLKVADQVLYGKLITVGAYPQTFLCEIKTDSEYPADFFLENLPDHKCEIFGTLEKRKSNDKIFNYVSVVNIVIETLCENCKKELEGEKNDN